MQGIDDNPDLGHAPSWGDQAADMRTRAETYYRSGTHHCAEAVLEVVREYFAPEMPSSVVRMASGFGGGSGAGCICGAVSGGTLALGMVLGDRSTTSRLTRELHGWFTGRYGATCCKTIRRTHPGACPRLTGDVAGKIGEMLTRQ